MKQNNIISKRINLIPKSKNLFIIIPPWHGKLKYNFFIRKCLKKQKISSIEYEFKPEILNSNFKKTKKYFKKIKIEVQKDIQKLKKRNNFQNISIIGDSLGCVNATMIANDLKYIINEILIVPGDCLAESLWFGKRTQYLRKEFEAQNISLKKLKKEWKELAPKNNFKNKKLLKIYLSKKDKIIPYYCGKQLVKSASKKCKIQLYENKYFGHYLTSINFFLFPKKFLSFN